MFFVHEEHAVVAVPVVGALPAIVSTAVLAQPHEPFFVAVLFFPDPVFKLH